MYHRLESPVCPVEAPSERPWAVSADTFARHLDLIRADGRLGVAMDRVHRELEAGRAVPPHWVAITFDDGNLSDHVHALPLLAARGFTATFFVGGARVDTRGGLTRGMLGELAAAGMHIGSHAMTHRFLTTLSADEETEELERSRDLLTGAAGAPVDHFAPPGGRWSTRTAASLRRTGYRAVSTSVFGCNDCTGRRFAYRRMPVVRATTDTRLIAMVRGDRLRLVPGYLRAGSLGMARRVLGEAGYSRARAGAGLP